LFPFKKDGEKLNFPCNSSTIQPIGFPESKEVKMVIEQRMDDKKIQSGEKKNTCRTQ